MQHHTITIFFLFLATTFFAQEKLKVTGDARIDGLLKVIKGEDNTVVGLNAGTALTTGADNAFMGEKAGQAVTTGSDNVFLGNDAGRNTAAGNDNVFVGGDAGESNTSGSGNVFIGSAAGFNNTNRSGIVAIGDSAFFNHGMGAVESWAAIGNTAVGYKAGFSNTKGYENTFMGSEAGYAITEGSQNTFLGWRAGYANTTGTWNTFVGRIAGLNNIGGNGNTFLGFSAGRLNTTGADNIFLGRRAGDGSSTGNDNTFVGSAAGQMNTSGNRNTFVGANAGFSSIDDTELTAFGYGALASFAGNGGLENAFVMGNRALVTSSHSGVLGNISTQKIGGYVNWGTAADGRMEKNIQEDVKGLDFVLQLRPVSYQLDAEKLNDHIRAGLPEASPDKNVGRSEKEREQEKKIQEVYQAYLKEKSGIRYTGFIAQEVEKAAEASRFPFSGIVPPSHEQDHYSLRYAEFTVPLVKATQEQQTLIDAQDRKIISLQQENRQLRDEVNEIKQLLNRLLEAGGQSAIDQTIQVEGARLLQNSPNPFAQTTNIDYFLPEGAGKAQIRITDMTGRIIKLETLEKNGQGRLQLQTQNLPAGAYAYSLLLDGQVVDTKQMVISR